MSEQDFPQRPEEGDAEEALTLDPNFIFDRGEEEDVDREEETTPTEATLAQAETAPLASRIPLVKAEEPAPTESEASPTQAPSPIQTEETSPTESEASPTQAPSATHAEGFPLTESSAPLAQAETAPLAPRIPLAKAEEPSPTEPEASSTQSPSPIQTEEASDAPEAPVIQNSATTVFASSAPTRRAESLPEPQAAVGDAAENPKASTTSPLSSTPGRSPISQAPLGSPLSSTSNTPPLSPTSASSRIASLPATSPISETPSSSPVLETQSVGDEGATSSSSPSASAPPDELAESMWAAVRDRSRQSDNESAPALAQPVLAGEQPLTGEEVELPGEITPEDDIVGESAPVITGQIETVTLGSHTTTIPVMTGEIPVMTRIDPTPTPRDVLAHRVEDEDGEAESFEELEDVEEGASLFEPLDETSVQRRSLINPSVDLDEPEPEASWRPREDIGEQAVEELGAPAAPHSLDDAIFDGASVQAEVPSRTGAHWASLFGYLLLVPLAWFLIADSGARLTLNDAGSVATGNFAPLPFLELLGGLVLVLFLFLLARKSSLGPWFVGVLTTLVGLPSLIVPGLTAEFLLPYLRMLSSSSTFGQNLSHHVQASAYSGRLLLVGLVLMGIGFLSHSVRRIGRNEELLRAEVERINPAGAHFTARARRRAAKAAARF
ncbi:hypothetical protein [Schaalia cardiffensis]|uniref:hypothetical protein n=1 Tax=Schaalia cardiffensis TaxID=181487 RepID=UPI002AB1A634|nr:hypothetical protein [Schaalia cardiffensis]